MKKIGLILVMGVLTLVVSLIMAEHDPIRVKLRPVRDVYSLDVPFYQAVPVAKGKLHPEGKSIQLCQEDVPLRAQVTPLAYWADGSVRWLAVEGIWSEGTKKDTEWAICLDDRKEGGTRPQWRVEQQPEGNGLWVVNEKGEQILAMSPFAARMAIDLPRPVLPVDPEWLDAEGQYTWAQPFESLSEEPQVESLSLVVVDQVLENETEEYVQYRIRGNSSGVASGQLEWQLRLRIYPDSGLIRSEMTWKVLWDVQRYALVSAAWKIREPNGYSSLITGENQAALEDEGKWILLNEVDGRSGVWINGQLVEEYPQTDRSRNVLILSDKERVLGVAIPDFGKKGPSHCIVSPREMEIAVWSHLSGKALDLRSSGQPGEYGVHENKLESDGRGFAYTLEVSLILSQEEAGVRELAVYEESREGIWFPGAEELEKTSALEPFSRKTIEQNPEYFSGLQANLLFLVRARDAQKWYGLVNYGDFRTNFARGRDEGRGLYPGHWVLNGRYGWRNGSGGVTEGLLKSGLLLEDREIALAGWEHARHVADVDICHGSFFKPYRRSEGGMHRRNRDHWSGSVQMQYSSTSGMYLASWLGGNQRVRDALTGIRDYAERDGGVHSAFAAQAWVFRYMETQDPEDYQRARQFLENTASFWAEAGKKLKLEGIAALYSGNFRRISDGLKTLIAFYEATEKEEYLAAIYENMEKHDLLDSSVSLAARGYVLGWLAAHGSELVAENREPFNVQMASMVPARTIDFRNMDFSELTHLIVEGLPPSGSPLYRESNAITARAFSSFLAMKYWRNQQAKDRKQEMSAGKTH